MEEREISTFFGYLGEIQRDITLVEFLMRCAIAKYDNEISKFPKPPYTKGKIYKEYPNSFGHFSFEIIVNKFNSRFPRITIPKELIELRDAMAHWMITEVNNSGTTEIIKFKELESWNWIKIEFKITLDLEKLKSIRDSLRDIRRLIAKEVNEL